MVRDSMETETLARLYLDQGHPERAAPIFKRILAEDPGCQSAAEGLRQCLTAMRTRPAEEGMDREKKLLFLRQLLSRLTGEAMPEEPLPAEPASAQPKVAEAAAMREPSPPVEVKPVVQEVVRRVVEKVADTPPPLPAASTSPRERKIQLLQAMLQRLTEA